MEAALRTGVAAKVGLGPLDPLNPPAWLAETPDPCAHVHSLIH